MTVFRLSKKKYAKTLTGKGAARFGNRWNSKGVEMVYTTENRALAMAEVAVHLSLANLPDDFVMIEIFIPEELNIEVLDESKLDTNWNAFPHNPKTQLIGNQFIKAHENPVLKVPSAVVKGDYNYLINPNHKEAKRIKIRNTYDFPFDQRLFR